MSTFRDKLSRGHGVNVLQTAGIAAIIFLLFAYYVYTWRNAFNFRSALHTCSSPFCDFTEYYYPMGESIFQTAQPVKGFVYSPFTAILFASFAPFGSGTALLLWGILQGICILLYLVLFRRLFPTGRWIHLLFVFLALSSLPLLHNLASGQVGIITTVLILGTLSCYERGQRVIAAFLLAFGLSFKFFPIIFLLPFVIRRDFRFLLYSFIGCAVFLFMIPALLLGVDGTGLFYSALFDSYRHFDWVISNYNSQYFPHVLGRLAGAGGFNAYTYLPFLRWISYGIAAINVGFLYLIQRAHLPRVNLWSFHILFLTIPFILPTSWPTDLVYISFAQGLLAWQVLKENHNKNPSRYAVLILVLASILFSNIIFFNYIGSSHGYGFYGVIFWSDVLLLTASYVELLPSALRKSGIIPPGATGSREVTVRVGDKSSADQNPFWAAPARFDGDIEFVAFPAAGVPVAIV